MLADAAAINELDKRIIFDSIGFYDGSTSIPAGKTATISIPYTPPTGYSVMKMGDVAFSGCVVTQSYYSASNNRVILAVSNPSSVSRVISCSFYFALVRTSSNSYRTEGYVNTDRGTTVTIT